MDGHRKGPAECLVEDLEGGGRRADHGVRPLADDRHMGLGDVDRAGCPSSSLPRGDVDDGASCSRRRGCRTIRAWVEWAEASGGVGVGGAGSVRKREEMACAEFLSDGAVPLVVRTHRRAAGDDAGGRSRTRAAGSGRRCLRPGRPVHVVVVVRARALRCAGTACWSLECVLGDKVDCFV